jgi:HD-GYP domain-containing protein (c-di-GMP phosphodiesterase class II)
MKFFDIPDANLDKFRDLMSKWDTGTLKHSERVAGLMERFALSMHLPEQQVRHMMIAGLVHDSGKLLIDKSILGKIAAAESLEPAEKDAMRNHIYCDWLPRLIGDLPTTVLLAVRHHHECWDGSGYPDGLKEQEIPPTARMLTVCDVFDAVSTTRPGKRSLTPQQAAAELILLDNSKLDPKLTDFFLTHVMNIQPKSSPLKTIMDRIKAIGKKNTVV